MTPYRKKLIEVALPLEAINAASAQEKGNPFLKGHPRNLHQWWARRPLAACRAVLFASLVDDPDSDPTFRKADGTVDEDRAGVKRADLFRLIEELVKWENSNNDKVINAARAEIARCIASRKIELGEFQKATIVHGPEKGKPHPKGPIPSDGRNFTAWEVLIMRATPEVVNAFLIEHAPPVLDPFCGGGSIPLEAQRLGLRVYGSDLNPVPVLITKALVEIPPKFAGKPPVNPAANARLNDAWTGAQGLAEDVTYYAKWLRDEAERRIGHLFPKVRITAEMSVGRPDLKPYVGEELPVLAWIWGRTVASPNPAVHGTHVPLVKSFWLSTKKGKEAWVDPVIDKKANAYRFAVHTGEPEDSRKVSSGTKIGRGCKFRCLLSDQPISDKYVKEQGMSGLLRARLMAIVAEGPRGRLYISPTQPQEDSALVPKPNGLTELEAPIGMDKRAIWCLLYGLDRFDKLFTPRQLTILGVLSDLIRESREHVLADAKKSLPNAIEGESLDEGGTDLFAYAEAVATFLAFAVDKAADYSNMICTWNPTNENIGHLFTKQAIPMAWDFAEANLLESGLAIDQIAAGISKTIALLPASAPGRVTQLDAAQALSAERGFMPSTDPPYYDNIGYADLSDFFYVWLRRSLGGIYRSLFTTVVTPKSQELIASPYRHNGDSNAAMKFFEDGFSATLAQIRNAQSLEFPLTVFYAFKQAEDAAGESEDTNTGTGSRFVASTGWETMLEGLVRAGFLVDGTWPIRTERAARSVGIGTNALASSIVLSCRPRPADAPVATRREFLSALKRELPDSLRHLQQGNIAPVDLAQASIGPGMAIYTRYAKVLEADGSVMAVRSALAAINQTLDEVLAEQEGEFDPDTRWAVAWFEQFGMEDGPFGQAETLSRAKNTAVNGLVEAGIISARAGKVRLLNRSELLSDWNPSTDKRRVHWEIAQYLIRAHDTAGESAAADLLRQLGAAGEIARDLAYRLYSICERKKWPAEALAYNSLVIAWPEIAQLARKAKPVQAEAKELF